LSFNRVIRQRQGSGEATFVYDDIVPDFDYEYSDAEKPVCQTNMIERNGHPVHYIYNKFGNLILKEEYVFQRGSNQLLRWRYRYNADGAPIGILTPEGQVKQYYYGRDDYLLRYDITDDDVSGHDDLTAEERLAFGNLFSVVERGTRYEFSAMNLSRGVWADFFPNVISATNPSDIIRKFTYESYYQQIMSLSDPRYTISADPRHPESILYQKTLTKYEYSGPINDPNLYLSRIFYPDVLLKLLIQIISKLYLNIIMQVILKGKGT
jgi:YD repeat-containing protein